jgi:beta-glucanase (GH16 family)
VARKEISQKIPVTIVMIILLAITVAYMFGGFVPKWSEDFNGPAGSPADNESWSSVINGGGGGNQELSFYIPEANALDGKGNLVITANPDAGRFPAWYGPSKYVSGKLWTAGKVSFKYGHIEIRAALPDTAGKPGAWPAIWMLGQNYPSVGWADCGEIDIMESFGRDGIAGKVTSAAHTPTDHPAKSYAPTGFDASAFHVYALDWRPTSLIFSVDGFPYHTILKSQMQKWPFDQPFFMILNVAIGGTMGGDPAPGVYPYKMLVDYVHVTNSEVTKR